MTQFLADSVQNGAHGHPQSGKASLVAIGLGGAQRITARLQKVAPPFGQVLIIDPEAEPSQQIAGQMRGDVQFLITAAALDEQDGTADLTFYTVPWLRSFQTPTDRLRELFPNLRAKATRTVPTISAKTLADRMASLPQPFALWIEAAGSEMRLLTLLDRAGLLQSFSTLTVQCCEGSFFQDAAPRDAVQTWLEQRGFCMTAGDLDEADWPRLHFRLEMQQPEAGSAGVAPLPDAADGAPASSGSEHFMPAQTDQMSHSTRLAGQEKRPTTAAQDKTNLAEQLADLKSDAAARIKRINDLTAAVLMKSDQLRAETAACTKMRDDLGAAQTKLGNLEALVADLKLQLAAATAHEGALECQLAEAQSQIAAQLEQINHLTGLANESQRNLDALQADASLREHRGKVSLLEAQTEISTLQQTEKDQRARIVTLERTTESLSNDLSVALRLQALHTADLGDLRDRYAKNLAEKDRQDALLQNLMARLAKAAEYLAEMDRLPPGAAATTIISEASRPEDLPAPMPSQARLKAAQKAKRKSDKKAKKRDEDTSHRGQE